MSVRDRVKEILGNISKGFNWFFLSNDGQVVLDNDSENLDDAFSGLSPEERKELKASLKRVTDSGDQLVRQTEDSVNLDLDDKKNIDGLRVKTPKPTSSGGGRSHRESEREREE